MRYELNPETCTLKTYYNIIIEYSYLHGHYDDDFLDYCYDAATLEADGSETPAAEYSHDNMYAQVIISTAEFLVEHDTFDSYADEDWNGLFVIKDN